MRATEKEVTDEPAGEARAGGGESYLNDIVADVHARRLALIAPLGRPCYPCRG